MITLSQRKRWLEFHAKYNIPLFHPDKQHIWACRWRYTFTWLPTCTSCHHSGAMAWLPYTTSLWKSWCQCWWCQSTKLDYLFLCSCKHKHVTIKRKQRYKGSTWIETTTLLGGRDMRSMVNNKQWKITQTNSFLNADRDKKNASNSHMLYEYWLVNCLHQRFKLGGTRIDTNSTQSYSTHNTTQHKHRNRSRNKTKRCGNERTPTTT